ncbi:MAG: D-glycero-beta-D-manno-heptose 1,7-bisphosphate 7-phosphatase [Candidatus Lindowbacteria bacterium]|nr:D-glycero-beta-D-manno-heptose 1,7-bisphosphate 7-phosphatase [Candidatus Lindowbacteria bacterium]
MKDLNLNDIKAVFLDRDGVINAYRPGRYVNSADDFEFIPGSLTAISRLTDAGIRVFVVSNQAGVGKGLLEESMLNTITNKMLEQIKDKGGDVLDVFYCLHTPDDGCDCRKPKPGLLVSAMTKYKLNPKEVIFAGDSETDLQAAQAAGCRSVLVLTGKTKPGTENQLPIQAQIVVPDLLSFVASFLGAES